MMRGSGNCVPRLEGGGAIALWVSAQDVAGSRSRREVRWR
jgi:hypothetical protein